MSSSSSKRSKAEERARKAAEFREAKKREERRRQTFLIAAVIGVIALIVGLGFMFMKLTDDPTPTKLDGASDEYALALGDAGDGNHQVVIYEDFLCPFCGEVEAGTRKALQQGIDDGTVYVEYRPINLLSRMGDYSMRATNALRVVQQKSGDDVAKKFHDLLFENQPQEGGQMPDDDWLVEQAVSAGADEADVRPGIEGLTEKQWVDDATNEAMNDMGVNSTPTIYIDGKLVEGASVADIVKDIEDAAK